MKIYHLKCMHIHQPRMLSAGINSNYFKMETKVQVILCDPYLLHANDINHMLYYDYLAEIHLSCKNYLNPDPETNPYSVFSSPYSVKYNLLGQLNESLISSLETRLTVSGHEHYLFHAFVLMSS